MKNVYLFEDHDQALKIWQKKKIKNLDLVHVDAHIDFGFPQAEPLETVLNQARSVQDLKYKMEYSLAFSQFEKDFSKQIDIGNYIYPAMRDGIVNDFYWVVPGGSQEFRKSKRLFIGILRQISKIGNGKSRVTIPAADTIATEIFGRKINICTLQSLPFIKQDVLLDIDTDFLVIDSVKNADNTTNIGKRHLWIEPAELVKVLRKKVGQPKIVTIAYSANGGYTPMKSRHLGDEMANLFAPEKFSRQYKRNSLASGFFNSFEATGRKKDYQAAVRLNKIYRSGDNNYGQLYLAVKKYGLAEKEFLKVMVVDSGNPASLTGLGLLALEKKDFKKAKILFTNVLKPKAASTKSESYLFSEYKKRSLLGLAEAEYGLKNPARAKRLLAEYIKLQPLEPVSRYLLARIYDSENDFSKAARCYQDSSRLGLGGIEVFYRLAKILFRLKEKDSIIKYIKYRIKCFKKEKKKPFSEKEKKQLAFIEQRIKKEDKYE